VQAKLPVKAGRPKRADRYALAERDAEISRMAAKGVSYAEIAERFGYSGTGAVANAIRRARDAVRAQGADELKAAQRATLDALEEDAWKDLASPGYKVASNSGKVIRDDQTGEPLPDLKVKNDARDLILKITRARMELEGTAAPRRSIQATFTIEQRQALEAEILASDQRLTGRGEIYEAEVISDDQ
jgi:DNA-binding CsgD family transcriptional regulator